jgi:hypothetical protein
VKAGLKVIRTMTTDFDAIENQQDADRVFFIASPEG